MDNKPEGRFNPLDSIPPADGPTSSASKNVLDFFNEKALNAISSPGDSVPKKADRNTKKEQKRLEQDKEEFELENDKQNRDHRRQLVPRLFNLTVGWILMILAIVVFQGFGFWEFNLSDPVLIALISTTTVNVFGLCHVMLKYVFDRNGH